MENKILEKSYDYLVRYEDTEKKLLGDNVFSNLRIGREKAGFYDENMPRILMFGSLRQVNQHLLMRLRGKSLLRLDHLKRLLG